MREDQHQDNGTGDPAPALTRKLESVPREAGCYIFKDDRARILYVGKAKSLYPRVRSYFQSNAALTPRTSAMVEKVRDLDFIVTKNEVEALILEQSLIKEHKPRYNVRLRDDKKYPFIVITWHEELPRVFPTRQVKEDRGEYFGPYTDVKAMRKTLWLLQSIFPIRTCPGDLKFDSLDRECLEYFIHRCAAPCTARIPRDEYMELVKSVRLFLLGQNTELRQRLVREKESLSAELKFEDAARLRDRIRALDKVTEKQVVLSRAGGDLDVLALVRDRGRACGMAIKVREGKLLASQSRFYKVNEDDDETELFQSFFCRFYETAREIPATILLSHLLPEENLLGQWMTGKRGGKVALVRPLRGERRSLVDMAKKNAGHKLEQHLEEQGSGSERSTPALRSLQEALGLRSLPRVIECFDISNIQGEVAVGSMVTFRSGKPFKSGYRRFKIRTVKGADDFAMMEEILRRRFLHVIEGKDRLADLILIDGGKGQLSRAVGVLRELGLQAAGLAALAKKREEVFLPGSSEPILIHRSDLGLRLLQRARDEAHRFAIEYHRKLRSKRSIVSELDRIPGIGEKKKLELLYTFGSLDGIKRASVDDLRRVSGIGHRLAQVIRESLDESD